MGPRVVLGRRSKMQLFGTEAEALQMSKPMPVIVKCQDPGDDTGDVIVELPTEILEEIGLTVGDELSIELIEGLIVLKPVRAMGHAR